MVQMGSRLVMHHHVPSTPYCARVGEWKLQVLSRNPMDGVTEVKNQEETLGNDSAENLGDETLGDELALHHMRDAVVENSSSEHGAGPSDRAKRARGAADGGSSGSVVAPAPVVEGGARGSGDSVTAPAALPSTGAMGSSGSVAAPRGPERRRGHGGRRRAGRTR